MEFFEVLFRVAGAIGLVFSVVLSLRYFFTVYLAGEPAVDIGEVGPFDYLTSTKYWWPEKQEHPLSHLGIGAFGLYMAMAPILVSLLFIAGGLMVYLFGSIRKRNLRVRKAQDLLKGVIE